MSERQVVLDQPILIDEQAEAVRKATDRADRAEAELAKLKNAAARAPSEEGLKTPPSPSTAHDQQPAELGGIEELRKDSMMAHLLDALEAGKDIGHYGRLVFAMVARHFLTHAEVLQWMTKDPDDTEEKATTLLRQVEGKDYTPPKRDKILAYQAQQDFPIVPNPDDPDCGNIYKNLKFPKEIYDHIGHYQEAKQEAS